MSISFFISQQSLLVRICWFYWLHKLSCSTISEALKSIIALIHRIAPFYKCKKLRQLLIDLTSCWRINVISTDVTSFLLFRQQVCQIPVRFAKIAATFFEKQHLVIFCHGFRTEIMGERSVRCAHIFSRGITHSLCMLFANCHFSLAQLVNGIYKLIR